MITDNVESAGQINEICHFHKRQPRYDNIFIRVNINEALERLAPGFRSIGGHLVAFAGSQKSVLQQLYLCGKAPAHRLHGKFNFPVDKRFHHVADEQHQHQQADQKRYKHGADAQPDQTSSQGGSVYPSFICVLHEDILTFLLLF